MDDKPKKTVTKKKTTKKKKKKTTKKKKLTKKRQEIYERFLADQEDDFSVEEFREKLRTEKMEQRAKEAAEREHGVSARKTKCTPEKIESIAKLIENGNTIAAACAFNGINRTMYVRWLKNGSVYNDEAIDDKYKTNIHPIYGDFHKAVEKALATFEVQNVMNIQKHAKKAWQASAFLLQKRFPKEWGIQQQKVEHTGGITSSFTGEVNHNHKHDVEEVQKKIQKLIMNPKLSKSTLELAEAAMNGEIIDAESTEVHD